MAAEKTTALEVDGLGYTDILNGSEDEKRRWPREDENTGNERRGGYKCSADWMPANFNVRRTTGRKYDPWNTSENSNQSPNGALLAENMILEKYRLLVYFQGVYLKVKFFW